MSFYCFGACYYDRNTGRWLSPDPISSEFSPYSYVYNRPLNYIDRFGLGGILPDDDEGEGSGGGSGGFSNFYFQRQIQRQFDAVWAANRGYAPGYSRWAGGTGSYIASQSGPGGHFKRQTYSTAVGSGPFIEQGEDEWWIVEDWTPDWNRINLFTPAIGFAVGTFGGLGNVAKEFSMGKLFVDSKGRITTKPIKMSPAGIRAAGEYASGLRFIGRGALAGC